MTCARTFPTMMETFRALACEGSAEKPGRSEEVNQTRCLGERGGVASPRGRGHHSGERNRWTWVQCEARSRVTTCPGRQVQFLSDDTLQHRRPFNKGSLAPRGSHFLLKWRLLAVLSVCTLSSPAVSSKGRRWDETPLNTASAARNEAALRGHPFPVSRHPRSFLENPRPEAAQFVPSLTRLFCESCGISDPLARPDG